jgi:hypothetical protein
VKNSPHSGRAHLYYMSIRPEMGRPFNKFIYCNKDWTMIELIRDLSNVSTNFRKEFGDVFWARTHIIIVDAFNNGLFPRFLEERPSVRRGIRQLTFDLKLNDFKFDNDHDYNHEAQQYFLEFCQSVSTLPNLQELYVTLEIHEDEFHKVESGTQTRNCLEAVRNLPVTKWFNLNIEIVDAYDESESDADERHEDWEEEWPPKIREMMLPITLRSSKNQTETEKYIRSRPVEESDSKKYSDESACTDDPEDDN